MRMRKLLLVAFVIGFLSAEHSYSQQPQQGNPNSPKLIINGSEAMFPAINDIANEYRRTSQTGEKLFLNVQGQGSTIGFSALMDKQCNVVASTRKLTPQEIEEFKDRKLEPSKDLKDFMVAKEALCIVVSAKNPIYKLTASQVEGIFSGKIKNWKDVGGEDQSIKIFIRSNSSGCYQGFKDVFFTKDENYSETALMLSSNAKIKENLMYNENGISYLGYNSAVVQEGIKEGKLRVLKIALDDTNFVAPSYQNIDDGSYKLVRYCYLYTTTKEFTNNEEVKKFIEFAKSSKAADIWDDNGFWSLTGK